MDNIVLFKKTHPDAKTPYKKHPGDAGYDVFAIENVTVHERPVVIKVGLNISLPKGYYAEIHTRSSYGIKGARAHLGVIDEGYKGPIDIIMTSPEEVLYISKGDKIAQLIIRKRIEADFVEVKELPNSSRGKNGFGSTGK